MALINYAFKIKQSQSPTTSALRYGYRISKTNPDPYERVQYLYDAKGFTPAHMDFTNGQFDYGDWADIWFIKDNKPCMLKYDGTVDYYLDPNDYTKKEDGTASGVANTSYGGNAMAQIPLVWVYRYEDDNYLYEIISNEQYDENYKAYAHTDASSNIKPYFYAAMFGASGDSYKLRSLSGQTLNKSLNAAQQVKAAKYNGDGWYTGTWSQRSLINTLLVLIGKSCNSQAVFGNGNTRSNAPNNSSILQAGTLKNKGQFFGYNSNNQQVKVFHIEGYFGNQWLYTAGLINNGGTLYVKMTPEGLGYRTNDVSGYSIAGTIPAPSLTNTYYISTMTCNEYGMIPNGFSGSGSTYFCDRVLSTSSQLNYLLVGGGVKSETDTSGIFAFRASTAPTTFNWDLGCYISYV